MKNPDSFFYYDVIINRRGVILMFDTSITKIEFMKFLANMDKAAEWARNVGMKESDITEAIRAVRKREKMKNENRN